MSRLLDVQAARNEGRNHGPWYGWSDNSTETQGIDFGTQTAVVTWSVTFPDISCAHPTTTKVELGDLALRYFSQSQQKWVDLSRGPSSGGYDHKEDFSTSDPSTVVSSNGRLFSAPPVGNFSERWAPRCEFPTTDAIAFFGSVRHRLVDLSGNALSFEDEMAQWLVQCGVDYWPFITGGTGNTSAGQGRILRVMPWWRTSFYVTTGTSVDFDLYPPIDITEVL